MRDYLAEEIATDDADAVLAWLEAQLR